MATNHSGVRQVTLDLFTAEGAPDLPDRAQTLAAFRAARIQQIVNRRADPRDRGRLEAASDELLAAEFDALEGLQ